MNRRPLPARTMRAPDRRFSPLSLTADALALMLGIGTQFVVHVVGDLPVGELLVLILGGPLLVMYRRRAFRRDLLPYYALTGLWFLNQVLTDVYRHTPAVDWMRGYAAIVFFALDMAFASILLGRNERRKLLYAAGLILGSVAAVRLQPNEMSLAYPWKFGYSTGVNLCVVMLSCYFYNRRRYLMVLGLLAGISAVNLLFNYRSPVLIFLLTIALVVPVVPERIGPWRVLPPEGTRMRLVVLISFAVLASVGASTLVKVLSASGALGEEAQQKNEQQARVKGGMLLGGRPEILATSTAVKDSPILGHGSWAKGYKYVEILYDAIRERGGGGEEDINSIEENSEGLIPTHSHLMGAWVWAGIMGAVFWGYVWWMLARGVMHLAIHRPPTAPLYMNLFVGMLWAVLFSPFGAGVRLMDGAVIVMLSDVLAANAPRLASAGKRYGSGWRRGAVQPRRAAIRPLPASSAGA